MIAVVATIVFSLGCLGIVLLLHTIRMWATPVAVSVVTVAALLTIDVWWPPVSIVCRLITAVGTALAHAAWQAGKNWHYRLRQHFLPTNPTPISASTKIMRRPCPRY